MTFPRGSLLLIVGTFGASAPLATRPTAAAPCVRPAPRQLADGATVVLSETTRFPCTLEFVTTSVVLRAGAGSNVEEIGTSVARGPDGRFYTSMNASGRITVWNPDGSWRHNFGQVGQGPGEFARGGKAILFDKDGRLFVGDNNRRWSIFSPTYDFVTTIPAGSTGIGSFQSAVLLADGNLLTSMNARDAAYHIFDLTQPNAATPPLVRAFGPALARASSRRLSYSGGNTFWAAPPDGAGLGYILELWRTDGTLVRTIRRDVPWMPKGEAALSGGELPPPEMEIMHEDGTGLVFVAMMVPNKSLLALSPAERRNQTPGGPADKAIDIYLEVIDANAGVVLASSGPIHPSEAVKQLPRGFLPGSRQGYRREEDSDGFPIMRIVEYQLVKRN
jgi:hypothetical protein